MKKTDTKKMTGADLRKTAKQSENQSVGKKRETRVTGVTKPVKGTK